jgi:hypothetical protein
MLKVPALAGCLLVAACASRGPVVDGPLSPIDASTLVSKKELQFRVAQSGRKRILVYQPSGGAAMPVGSISEARHSIQKGLSSELHVTTIEQLYVVAMRLDPLEIATADRSQADLLRDIAAARQAAGAGIPWRVVSLARASVAKADDDEVSVRVFGDHGPIEGASVIFHRAPHMGCVAKVGKDGVATCQLVDQHGHEEEHSEHENDPVVVTFPGDVRPDRVLLPTTLVMR